MTETRYFTGRPCSKGHIAERKLSNRECIVCRREYDRRKYAERNGLPEPEYEKPEKCELCGHDNDALALDHCHVTGEFRGWLCKSCNCGLGMLGDNIEGIQKAIKYLTKTRPGAQP